MALAQSVGHQQLDRFSEQLLAGVAEQALRLPVHQLDRARAIDHHHAAGSGLDHGTEPRFGALAGGDIHHGGEHEEALIGLDRVQPDLDGDLDAVLAEPVQLPPGPHRPRLRVGEEVGPVPGMALAQPVRYQQLDRFPDQLLAGIAEQALGLPVDQLDRAGAIGHHHAAGSGLHHGTEPLFRALTGGDVHHGREHEEALVGLDRVQPDLDRDLDAVLAEAVQLPPRSHRPSLRVGEEVGPEDRMPVAEPFRDQVLDGLVQHLLARVAEQPLGLPIHEHDLARAVHHDHAARRRLHHDAKPRLGAPLERRAAIESRRVHDHRQREGDDARHDDNCHTEFRAEQPRLLAPQAQPADNQQNGEHGRHQAACRRASRSLAPEHPDRPAPRDGQ